MAMGLSRQGTRKAVTVLTLLAFAAWCVQLGGVASLQQACPDELPTELNDVTNIREYLATAKVQTAVLAATPAGAPTQNLQTAQVLGSVLQAMRGLQSRSAMTAFAFESDYDCSMIYRYSWLTVAVQVALLGLIALALATGALYNMRVALCTLLLVPIMLAINNAHGLLTLKDVVHDLTLLRGKVFFAGCIAAAFFNCLLVLAMGSQDEDYMHRGSENGSVASDNAAHAKVTDGRV